MYKFLVEEVGIYYWIELLAISVFFVFIFSGGRNNTRDYSDDKRITRSRSMVVDYLILIGIHIATHFIPFKFISSGIMFSRVNLLPIFLFSIYNYLVYKDKNTWLKAIFAVYFEAINEIIFMAVFIKKLYLVRYIVRIELIEDVILIVFKIIIIYIIYKGYRRMESTLYDLEKRDKFVLGVSLAISIIGLDFVDRILGSFEYDNKSIKTINMYTKAVSHWINSRAVIGVVSMLNLYFYLDLAGKSMTKADRVATQSIGIANEKYFEKIVDTEEKISRVMHDIRNHMMVMRGMIDETSVESYYKRLNDYVEDLPLKVHTGNFVADVVINDKIDFMKDKGIDYDIKMAIPKDVIQDQHELSSILFNTIDNAIEASLNLDEEDRKIVIRSEIHGDFLKYSIANNYCACEDSEERLYGKKDKIGRGYGLKIVEDIVSKYQGSFKIIREDKFELRLYFKIR